MSEFDARPEAEKNDILSECGRLCEAFRATGKVVEEEGLTHTSRAVTIRPRGGKPVVTLGPFSEAREQLGSYFVIEAESLEEAIAVASLHPAAILGEAYGFGIEVRPVA